MLDPSISTDEYAKRLASLSPGFSGADIANLCNEAAILASRKDKKFVEQIDFEMASEKVIAGLEKKTGFTKEERRTVAVHESGKFINIEVKYIRKFLSIKFIN
jgi:AFG3 family protein